MRLFNSLLFTALFLLAGTVSAQDETDSQKREPGHYNTNRFKQLYEEFSTPNMFRTASGAPGPSYYQQQADYVMDIELDDKNKKLSGFETITYSNNSPDPLEFLWVQLDQNERAKDSKSPLIEPSDALPGDMAENFVKNYMGNPFDGGFNILEVKDAKGNPLKYTINQTMMRIDMPKVLKPGEKFVFSIKWWYNINDRMEIGGRSGYEYFEEDENYLYTIAQFFPRMAVYNEVEGW
ncbi:MAG: M1 family peptidase, partial [Aequorivita vladivostokensis]|nr:M1 family peptidase [Aequorivita vladivostokensis]